MIRLSSQHHNKGYTGFLAVVVGVMSRRRDPAPVKKSGPLLGTAIGSLYGDAIGVKPGVFPGPPIILNPENLQKPKLSVPTGVHVNPTTKKFGIELMQSVPGEDQKALNLRTPNGYTALSGRALIRISVWWMRNPLDRENVLQSVIDAVTRNIAPSIREQYEEAVPDIVQNQNCGSGWSSSAHFFLVGREGKVPTPVSFDNAGKIIFGVEEGEAFPFDGDTWMWSMDQTLKPTDQHQSLDITLVERGDRMAVAAADGS